MWKESSPEPNCLFFFQKEPSGKECTPRGVLGSEILLHTHSHTWPVTTQTADALPMSESLTWDYAKQNGGGWAQGLGTQRMEWPLPGMNAVGIARESQGTKRTGRGSKMRAARALLGSRLTLVLTSLGRPFFKNRNKRMKSLASIGHITDMPLL